MKNVLATGLEPGSGNSPLPESGTQPRRLVPPPPPPSSKPALSILPKLPSVADFSDVSEIADADVQPLDPMPAPASLPAPGLRTKVTTRDIAKELCRHENRKFMTELLKTVLTDDFAIQLVDKAITKRHGAIAAKEKALFESLQAKFDAVRAPTERYLTDVKQKGDALLVEMQAATKAATEARALLQGSISAANEITHALQNAAPHFEEHAHKVDQLVASLTTATNLLERVSGAGLPSHHRGSVPILPPPSAPPAATRPPKTEATEPANKTDSFLGTIVLVLTLIAAGAIGFGLWKFKPELFSSSRAAASAQRSEAAKSATGATGATSATASTGANKTPAPITTIPVTKLPLAAPKAPGTSTEPKALPPTSTAFDESSAMNAAEPDPGDAPNVSDIPRLKNGETGICIQVNPSRVTRVPEGGAIYEETSGRKRLCQAERVNAEQKLCGCPSL